MTCVGRAQSAHLLISFFSFHHSQFYFTMTLDPGHVCDFFLSFLTVKHPLAVGLSAQHRCLIYNWTSRANRAIQLQVSWSPPFCATRDQFHIRVREGAHRQVYASVEEKGTSKFKMWNYKCGSVNRVVALKPFHFWNRGLLIGRPAGLMKFSETSSCDAAPPHLWVTLDSPVTLNVPVISPQHAKVLFFVLSL